MVYAQMTRWWRRIFARCKAKIKDWRRKTTGTEKILYALLGILAIFGIYLFLVWWFDSGLDTKEAEKYLGAITIVGSVCGGIVLTLNALFLNRRAKAMDKSAKAHAKSAEAHVTENRQNLFNTAIKHLGDETESVRLGGIYALYELAKEDQYRKNVHEILCSHARSKTNEDDYKEQYKNGPSVEIQSLINLLIKSESDIFQGLHVNFEGVQLQGAKLWRARLQKANLTGAYLQGVNLREARLQGAGLEGAQLQRANLWKAKLQEAEIWGTQLQEACLTEAQLQEARLIEAQLQGADLREAQLQGAYLVRAQLQGADLWKAQLQGANLTEAQLQGANLREVQLQGASLWTAQLQGANLTEVQLQGADLREAQLQKARLWGAQLQGVFSSHLRFFTFQEIIADRINQGTEVNNVVLGGIDSSNFARIKESLDLEAGYWQPDKKRELQELLHCLEQERLDKQDIPDEEKIQYLKDQKAKTGSYDQGYADNIIAEYEEAMQN